MYNLGSETDRLLRRTMRKVYFLPNLITAFGLACGLFVIFKSSLLQPEGSYQELLHTSAILLLIAAFADAMDGAVARFMGAESEFGGHFDSLADAVTFGVAPAVLFLKTVTFPADSHLGLFCMAAAMLYSLCGVFRLVRFNVKAFQVKGAGEGEQTEHKKNFTGLPIPAAALAGVAANLFWMQKATFFSHEMQSVGQLLVMLLLGYLMVSRWKFPSVKTLHFRVPSLYLLLSTMLIALFVLYGIVYYFVWTLVALTWGYILVALVLAIMRMTAGRKSRMLEDFEPDPDEEA